MENETTFHGRGDNFSQATLSNLPVYYMSLFKMSASVRERVESIKKLLVEREREEEKVTFGEKEGDGPPKIFGVLCSLSVGQGLGRRRKFFREGLSCPNIWRMSGVGCLKEF